MRNKKSKKPADDAPMCYVCRLLIRKENKDARRMPLKRVMDGGYDHVVTTKSKSAAVYVHHACARNIKNIYI